MAYTPPRAVREPREITVFGSDGGGDLFALNAAGDKIYRLYGGAVHGDTEAGAGTFAIVAQSLDHFLDLMLSAVQSGEENWPTTRRSLGR